MKTWQKIRENPKLREQYLVRERVTDTIRGFFKQRGFHEMSTPILVPTPSTEANLEAFVTQLRTGTGENRPGFLIMSPEYSLKKLLAAGFENIFEMAKCFRNEEQISDSHNPEFTMLEWYRTRADYRKIMEDFEELFGEIIKSTRPGGKMNSFDYLGEKYDLTRPWPRISVAEAFTRYAGIEMETMIDEDQLRAAAEKKGYTVNIKTTWEQMFYQIFFNEIEPKLKASRKPAFVYDYPVSQAALARKKPEDPRFAERFEVYLAGLELGNCYSELTDAAEQRRRSRKELSLRRQSKRAQYGMDEDLLEALTAGIPETAGIAVGVDRLVMLAANVSSVAETLFFPAGELFGVGRE